MKLPGQAVFQLRLRPLNASQTELALTLRFLPRGLWGMLYWRLTDLFHPPLLRGMLYNMARAAGGAVLEPPAPFIDGGRTCSLE
jgi:hypothetical protein